MTKTNVKFTYLIVIVNFLTQILRDKLPQLIFDRWFRNYFTFDVI